jgi:hypothetical protein
LGDKFVAEALIAPAMAALNVALSVWLYEQ